MMDTLELTSAPVCENCAQLGSNDYYQRAQKECRAFINQLRRQFGKEPVGARLYVKANPHDFGTYYEVACKFDSDYYEAVDYAFDLEAHLPEELDEEAKQELLREGVFMFGRN